MESLRETTDTYRLIVTRRDASEILLSPSGSHWTLPRVKILSHHRVAEQLIAKVRRKWGIEAYCLFIAGHREPHENGGWIPCAVLESVKHNEKAPSESHWVPAADAAGSMETEEARVIRVALEELNSYRRGSKPGPFARPGWLRELFSWAQEQVTPLGVHLTGGFRQLNASPSFSLIRLETGGDALWFKATGEPNAHELQVTLLLARLFPGHLPEIVGVHSAWNGWLSAEAPGTALCEITELSAWERAARELGELQIASIGKSAELVEAGCRDLRIPRLVERIDPFLARMSEFMAAQEKASPAPLTDAELATLGEGLRESCSVLRSFGLADTLGHIDCNPGNILLSQDRCTFLDWAEGSVANPLFTFAYLREHMGRSGLKTAAAAERITTAYLRPWQNFFSPDELRRAMAASAPLAVFAYAVAGNAWRLPETLPNTTLAGYFRSLTRRMYRETIQAGERSELCLN